MWKRFLTSIPLAIPFRGGVNLHGDHLDAVPRRYADATEQTLQGDDGRLTETQEEEEGAAGGDEHGASCTQKTHKYYDVSVRLLLFYPFTSHFLFSITL